MGSLTLPLLSIPKQSDILDAYKLHNVNRTQARQQEPVGGASRFVQRISEMLAEEDMLVIFSGDAFNPSPSQCLRAVLILLSKYRLYNLSLMLIDF